MVFSFVLGANVLIEDVFGWPGVGAYAVKAVIAVRLRRRPGVHPDDGGILYILLNLLVDVVSIAAMDPRVRIRWLNDAGRRAWNSGATRVHPRHGEPTHLHRLVAALFTPRPAAVLPCSGGALAPLYDPLATDMDASATLQGPLKRRTSVRHGCARAATS